MSVSACHVSVCLVTKNEQYFCSLTAGSIIDRYHCFVSYMSYGYMTWQTLEKNSCKISIYRVPLMSCTAMRCHGISNSFTSVFKYRIHTNMTWVMSVMSVTLFRGNFYACDVSPMKNRLRNGALNTFDKRQPMHRNDYGTAMRDSDGNLIMAARSTCIFYDNS